MQRNLAALAVVLSSCASDLGPARPGDAGAPDAGAPDAGAPDAGPPDAGVDWPHVDPFFFEARPTSLQVRAGESVALVVLVTREPGFETPVEVAAFGLPPGARTDLVTLGPSTEAVVLRIDTEQGAVTEGPRPFAISASADGVRQSLRITIEVVP